MSAPEPTELDFDATYKVAGHGGVAWRIISYDTEQVLIYEGCEFPFFVEYEEVVNTERVKCHMVGDDSVWTFDVSDLTKLDDEDYCSECGQVGCGWG